MKKTDRPADAAEAGKLSAHILPTSSTMVGVCMTVLTIGRIGPSLRLHFWLDKLLAVDAVLFLASAVLSFASMRQFRKSAAIERRAEVLLLIGLALLTVVAVALAFTIS